MPRLSIDEVYMDVAYTIAQLSYAERRKVGCVIVKENQIVSFGYNGTPKGFDNSCEHGYGEELTTKREVLHAESNALTKIAKSTMSSDGADLYTTTSPCFECSKLIVQSGINRVFYSEEYRDVEGLELLNKAQIDVIRLERENNGIQ